MATQDLSGVMNVLKTAEGLKTEMRHSWLSTGRHESVAEHSWRLSLMVILYAPHLDQPVDMERCLKLAIIHDLGEAKAGDIPVFDLITEKDKTDKFLAEKQAMEEISADLTLAHGKELFDLWQEYEDCQTYEARFVKALDKLEVHLQHVEAPLSTWSDIEYTMWFQPQWMIDHCRFDSTLMQVAESITEEAIAKLAAAGHDLDELKRAAA